MAKHRTSNIEHRIPQTGTGGPASNTVNGDAAVRAPDICPQCHGEAEVNARGVCDRCQRTNEAAHGTKLEVKWGPEDYKIHRNPQRHPEHPVIMEEEDVVNAEGRSANAEVGGAGESLQLFAEFLERFKTGAHVLKGYRGNQRLAFDCWMLALGFTEIAGAESDVELARLHGVMKQTVTKCKGLFQTRMGFAGVLPGQRDAGARENMRLSRLRQLEDGTSNIQH